jgi:hypothetical protein
LPFVQIVIGVCFYDFLKKFNKNFLKIIVLSIFSILILIDLICVNNKYLCLAKLGSKGVESSAIYDLIDWLNKNGYKEPIVFESHIRPMLTLLSKGKIFAKEFRLGEQLNLKDFPNKFYSDFKIEDNIYITGV